ncbi:MAG: hypothetical protein ANABAC_2863 [Anaerolineae bacterium]|nr:MAG: hypothetical protein ANABAC_2863 [Anaerolineae bacterium]
MRADRERKAITVGPWVVGSPNVQLHNCLFTLTPCPFAMGENRNEFLSIR